MRNYTHCRIDTVRLCTKRTGFPGWLLSLPIALAAANAMAAPEGTSRPFADEALAPAINAELLALGQVGEENDQWLTGATFTPKDVTFRGEKTFKVTVVLDAEGHVADATTTGMLNRRQIPQWSARIPDQNGGTLVGGITYGYRQVQAVQQQPFVAGKGWQLWGWSYAQVKEQDLMADSRIRFAERMPNGNILALGWCDGGNTVLGRDPRDLTKRSPFMGYQYGGGKGTSTLLTEIMPRGEPLHQAFLGVAVGDVKWDRWGRAYIVGCNMCAGTLGPFARQSSGSILILSRDLKQPLLDIRLGGVGLSYKNNAWVAVDLNEELGLLAVSGWTDQEIQKPVNSVRTRNGGDKDGMYALIRLWPAGTAGAATPADAPTLLSTPTHAKDFNPFAKHPRDTARP